MDKRTLQADDTIVECALCHDKGVFATLVHIDEHGAEELKLTVCDDCEHGKTFYQAKQGFHFKLVNAMVINVMPDTVFELDEDNWVHNMRTSLHEIKFSSPINTIEHLIERITDEKAISGNDTNDTDDVVASPKPIDSESV